MLVEILDKFTSPYDNDKTSDLLESLTKSGLLSFEVLEDIKNYMISKKGLATLEVDDEQYVAGIVETSIEVIN